MVYTINIYHCHILVVYTKSIYYRHMINSYFNQRSLLLFMNKQCLTYWLTPLHCCSLMCIFPVENRLQWQQPLSCQSHYGSRFPQWSPLIQKHSPPDTQVSSVRPYSAPSCSLTTGERRCQWIPSDLHWYLSCQNSLLWINHRC